MSCSACMMEGFANAPEYQQDQVTQGQVQQQAPRTNQISTYTCDTLGKQKCIYTAQGELKCGDSAGCAAGGGNCPRQ